MHENEVALDSELARLKKIGDLSPNCFVLVDGNAPELPILYVNRKFEKLVGYTLKESVGRNCRFLQGKDTDLQSLEIIRRALTQREAVHCDLLNYRKDGSSFWNRLVLVPIELSGRTYYLGFQHDVTQSKIDSNRVGGDKALSGEISHEIRNPLTIAMMGLSSGKIKLDKVVQALERISSYVMSLK